MNNTLSWTLATPNLPVDGPLVWVSDSGIRISQARHAGAPFYVTAKEIMGNDWWTRASSLDDAKAVAEQLS